MDMLEFVDEIETIAALGREGSDGKELAGLLESALYRVDTDPLAPPTAAVVPSGARSAHAFEVEDLLPAGRVRHPAWRRVPIEESSAEIVQILLATAGSRVSPRWYAEQHYEDLRERSYYRNLLQRACTALAECGVMKSGATGRRGANRWYTLPVRNYDTSGLTRLLVRDYAHRTRGEGEAINVNDVRDFFTGELRQVV